MREDLKVTVPEGESGMWKIRRITVSEEASQRDMLRGLMSNHGRYTPPGTYTQLLRGGTIVMSDTPDEIRDLYPIQGHLSGHILINGLGLGCVLQIVARVPGVTKVTVVEVSEDVIKLVWDHYKQMFGNKIELIHADALTYKPPKGARFNYVWHDIWDFICGDNLPQMHHLHRRYGRLTEAQGSWCRRQCERYSR